MHLPPPRCVFVCALISVSLLVFMAHVSSSREQSKEDATRLLNSATAVVSLVNLSTSSTLGSVASSSSLSSSSSAATNIAGSSLVQVSHSVAQVSSLIKGDVAVASFVDLVAQLNNVVYNEVFL